MYLELKQTLDCCINSISLSVSVIVFVMVVSTY